MIPAKFSIERSREAITIPRLPSANDASAIAPSSSRTAPTDGRSPRIQISGRSRTAWITPRSAELIVFAITATDLGSGAISGIRIGPNSRSCTVASADSIVLKRTTIPYRPGSRNCL